MSHREHTSIDALLDQAQWAHALARRLVKDASTADDVVQEAYAAALQNPPADPEGLRPWFARVLTNVARMHRRTEIRRNTRERAAAIDPTLPSASELAERAEGQRTLVEAVLKLEEPYRSTVLLRYFEDLSAAEIAGRQDIPAATVRWRLQEGLAKLRTELDNEFDGDTRSWCSLFLPLATMRAPGLPLAPVTPPLLGMVVMMKILKTAAVIGGLSVALFGLAAIGLLPGFGDRVEEVELPPETVSFRSQSQAVANADDTAKQSQSERTELAATKEERPQEKSFATIRARFVDSRGTAIKGVSFTAEYGLGASSRADGKVEVKLGNDSTYSAWGQATLIAQHPQFANQRCAVNITEGKLSDLGTIVLKAGGSIHGRVIDERGKPMANINVFVKAESQVENFGGMTSHSEGTIGRAEARTDKLGEFCLNGVSAGLRRVQASDQKHLHAKSGSIEVRAGQQSYGVEIVLKDPTPAALRITGIVLDPNGKPAARTSVEYKYTTFFGFSSGSGSIMTDNEGAFRIDARDKSAKYRLLAEPQTNTQGPGVIEGARPGKHYTIQLTQPESFEIHIRDEHGASLPGVAVYVHPVTYGADRQQDQLLTDDTGTVRAQVPLAPFKITASVLGYEKKVLGPFDPSEVDPRNSIRGALATAPVLRGRVMANGQALAFASVDLHHRCKEEVRHNGFPVWLNPSDFASAKTDADGYWAVTMRENKSFFVRVTAKGWAIHESQEFDATRALDKTALDFELDQGGSIHGHVSGPTAAGTIIGISRGDGAARTLRADSAGNYAFELLTPGRYLVQERTEMLTQGSSSTRSRWGSAHRETKWVCEVFAGQVTRYDLSTEPKQRCELKGRIRIGSEKLRGWIASLRTLRGEDTRVPRVQLEADGTFTLTTDQVGTYRLLIQGNDEVIKKTVIAELKLREGSNEFTFDVDCGTVEVSGIKKSPIPTILLWEGQDRLMFSALLPPNWDGSETVTGVPEGRVRVVGWTDKDAAVTALKSSDKGDDPRLWPTLGETTLQASGSANLSLTR